MKKEETKDDKHASNHPHDAKHDPVKDHPEGMSAAKAASVDKILDQSLAKQREYLDTLQRLQAEFDNFRKRTEKENSTFREYASKEFANKMLPVLDSFELALKASSDPEKFKKGMELIYAQLMSTMTEMGLKKIDCMNSKFDPYKHEVLMVDGNSKCKDDTVVEEFQKGYLWKEHVLRHSKVKIAKSGCKECDDSSQDDDGKKDNIKDHDSKSGENGSDEDVLI